MGVEESRKQGDFLPAFLFPGPAQGMIVNRQARSIAGFW
mgnify:FL=1